VHSTLKKPVHFCAFKHYGLLCNEEITINTTSGGEIMSETPQQYQERIFRTLGNREPFEVLQETPKILRRLLEKTGSEKWTKSVEEGKWTPAQVLAHFAEGEIVLGYRYREIATNSGTGIQAYDQNAWAKNAGYLTTKPEFTLQLFETVRTANLAYLKSLPQTTMENYGVHSERGKETLGDTIRLYAGHDLNHLKQIEQLLS
jgi:DinB superfamily